MVTFQILLCCLGGSGRDVAKVLACNIRSNGLISGLSLPGSPSSLPVVSAYADDTMLVVSSVPAILAEFYVYSLYERGLGAKLN